MLLNSDSLRRIKGTKVASISSLSAQSQPSQLLLSLMLIWRMSQLLHWKLLVALLKDIAKSAFLGRRQPHFFSFFLFPGMHGKHDIPFILSSRRRRIHRIR